MARKWKHYAAQAEGFRNPNVFPGPLGEGDIFAHYYRDAEAGVDYFGVYASTHTAWMAAQPKALKLTEIAPDAIPAKGPHVTLAARRLEIRMRAATTDADRQACLAELVSELAAKGLADPAILSELESAYTPVAPVAT
jgi:hypothetical protein